MLANRNETFGLLKSLTDAHTMGIRAAASLLSESGYRVIIAPKQIEDAIDRIGVESSQRLLAEWIVNNRINHIGISYRLDPGNAVIIVGKIVELLKRKKLFETPDAIVKSVFFAGLYSACSEIEKEYNGRIQTFKGGESSEETLIRMGVPQEFIPKHITDGCKYDKSLIEFGKKIIESGEYIEQKPHKEYKYPEYGTGKDTLMLRLNEAMKNNEPLIRAHMGPYSEDISRRDCINEFKAWCKELASGGFLDILSIGSSQLSQSKFGENWENFVNGGGVPVNSANEYREIWEASLPMLVRTYAGTKNIKKLAEIYEQNINISWHALSLWWFDELDGRGPNSLYANLVEHIETIKYIASTGKPVETNIPHHFAFRGCDDVTYIVSAYLGARITKKYGIKFFILQNMLNTPRSTWGVQDIAKSRVMLKLIKELEDEKFKVVLQTRTGLDYFKPDIDEAKVQLAASIAMMDDIEPLNINSPGIIHVVSYCEALFLANPDILNDSIKITRHSLKTYRKLKNNGMTPDVETNDIISREEALEKSARNLIMEMERSIKDLYSPEGLYIAFVAGFLPVPELWNDSKEFDFARNWSTKVVNGGVKLMDGDTVMSDNTRLNKSISNVPEAEYILKNKYF